MEPKTVVPKLRSLLRFDKLFRSSSFPVESGKQNGRQVSQFFMKGKSLCFFVFPATAENSIFPFWKHGLTLREVAKTKTNLSRDEATVRAASSWRFFVSHWSGINSITFGVWIMIGCVTVWFKFNLFEYSRNYVCVVFRVCMKCR